MVPGILSSKWDLCSQPKLIWKLLMIKHLNRKCCQHTSQAKTKYIALLCYYAILRQGADQHMQTMGNANSFTASAIHAQTNSRFTLSTIWFQLVLCRTCLRKLDNQILLAEKAGGSIFCARQKPKDQEDHTKNKYSFLVTACSSI